MRFVALVGLLTFGVASATDTDLPAWASADLQRNLRWMLERERLDATANGPRPAVRVGVWADAGVWHVGAKSIVTALEDGGVRCRVLDRSQLSAKGLKGLTAIVLPGGWAPHQWSAAGDEGLAAIRSFVEGGGRCVGICAGAYLLAKTVRYEGEDYPYPLGLFDGVAEGPVKGLKAYPEPGSVRLTVTPAGRVRGLEWLGKSDVYYSGGAFFHQGTDTVVLATYPDGTAAAIAKPVGKGEIVLIGAHPERPPATKNDDAPPPEHAGAILRSLLRIESP